MKNIIKVLIASSFLYILSLNAVTLEKRTDWQYSMSLASTGIPLIYNKSVVTMQFSYQPTLLDAIEIGIKPSIGVSVFCGDADMVYKNTAWSTVFDAYVYIMPTIGAVIELGNPVILRVGGLVTIFPVYGGYNIGPQDIKSWAGFSVDLMLSKNYSLGFSFWHLDGEYNLVRYQYINFIGASTAWYF